MTLHEIETLLKSKGLRLRKAVRSPERRRHVVEVQDVDTGKITEATGVDLEDALSNAIDVAKRRPDRKTKHRWVN